MGVGEREREGGENYFSNVMNYDYDYDTELGGFFRDYARGFCSCQISHPRREKCQKTPIKNTTIRFLPALGGPIAWAFEFVFVVAEMPIGPCVV